MHTQIHTPHIPLPPCRSIADDALVAYVEVKTSSSRTKDMFEISRNELTFAEAQGDRYHVYRVAGAGSANPSVMRLVDPVALWQAKVISLCILV